MQKDIQKSKGEQKHEPSKEAHKVQEIGNDINASLKENVGVGVGNYSSKVDREKSREHKEKYEEKKNKEEKEKNKKLDTSEKKWDEKKESGPVSSKVQEIGRNLNANLKENVGVGVGNYPSEVDREKANEHRENYEEKTEDQKEKFNEKKEELKERIESGETTGIYAHRIQEVGHNINATLKENIGVGLGNYPSEVDREKATEHREKYDERVKEETKPEIGEATSLGHKIREVAHNINANLKEMIGIGVGNYSSEVDRELATVHKEKYDEMTHTNEFDKTEDKEFKKDDDKQEKEVEGLKSEKKEQPTKKDLNTKESKLDESSKSKSGFGDNKL